MKFCIITKATFPEYFRCLFKFISNMGRFMGIRPDRNDLPTKLPVTFQYIRVGIRESSPYFIPARFISSPFPSAISFFQDRINLIRKFSIRIFRCLMDSITDHIIQMSQCIKIFHCLHILQYFPESHPVDFFIRSSFKDFTIIRDPVHQPDEQIQLQNQRDMLLSVGDTLLQDASEAQSPLRSSDPVFLYIVPSDG